MKTLSRRANVMVAVVLVALVTTIAFAPAARRGIHARRTIAAAFSDPDKQKRNETRCEILATDEPWAVDVAPAVREAIVHDILAEWPGSDVVVGKLGPLEPFWNSQQSNVTVVRSIDGHLRDGGVVRAVLVRRLWEGDPAPFGTLCGATSLLVLAPPTDSGLRRIIASIPLDVPTGVIARADVALSDADGDARIRAGLEIR